MATGNLILGTMKGKLGDIVSYNYNGKQAARVRRRTVANPKSDAQSVQRMVASTVAKFVSAFSEVLDNAVQTESGKVKNLAKIRSLNMRLLRSYATGTSGNVAGYVYKGSPYAAPSPYIVSRGSLAGLTPTFINGNDNEFVLGKINTRPQLVVDGSVQAAEAFPTIPVGQQITIMAIGLASDATQYGGQPSTESVYLRFALNGARVPVFLADGDGYFKLNPGAVDQTRALGRWQDLRFYDADTVSLHQVFDLSDFLACAAVIVSEKDGTRRSNAQMLMATDIELRAFAGNHVYPSYGAYTTPVDLASDVYLDNDAEVNRTATAGGNRAPGRLAPAVDANNIVVEFTNRYAALSPAPVISDGIITRPYNTGSLLIGIPQDAADNLRVYLDGNLLSNISAGDDIDLEASGQYVAHELLFTAEGYANVTVVVNAAPIPSVTPDSVEGVSPYTRPLYNDLPSAEDPSYNWAYGDGANMVVELNVTDTATEEGEWGVQTIKINTGALGETVARRATGFLDAYCHLHVDASGVLTITTDEQPPAAGYIMTGNMEIEWASGAKLTVRLADTE